MNLITITPVTSTDNTYLSAVNMLYMSAFPETERRPWPSLLALIGTPFFTLYVATESSAGRFVGFFSLWRLPDAIYVEHLAVVDTERGNGVGGLLVDKALEIAGNRPLVLEVELPETGPDAPRRISFYERHGLHVIDDITYFQPPYVPGQPELQLILMSSRPLPDIKSFVIQLHTLVYNQ